MKKFFRKIVIPVGIIFSLVGLVLLAASVFLPKDQIKDRVAAELVKATGAEVKIRSVGVQWWPKFGATLKDVEIHGTGPALAAATGSANELGDYSATLERFEIQLALGPLFRKEVLVEAIQLRGLDFDSEVKNENYRVVGADLFVNDLKISMDTAMEAGKPQPSAGKRPTGELIPEDLTLTFAGRSESLIASELPLRDIEFHGDLDTRLLTLESMTASVGDGQLEGNLEIDFERNPNGILDFEAEAVAVPAKALLASWAPVLGEKLEADLSGSVRGNCLLGTSDDISRTMTLSGDLGSGPGILWAREWLGDIAPYLGHRQELMDIKFSSLSHELRLEKGRYQVENVEINGLDTHWQGNGSLGLDGTIDMGVMVKLPQGFTPELGNLSFLAETLRDGDGRINLDLKLSGMAAKPQVGINLGSVQDAAESDAGEAVKKGLGGLLDKWKNR